MDDQQLNKFIGYSIGIILGYYILGFFIPLLTWGVILMVAFRIYQIHNKHK